MRYKPWRLMEIDPRGKFVYEKPGWCVVVRNDYRLAQKRPGEYSIMVSCSEDICHTRRYLSGWSNGSAWEQARQWAKI